MFILCLVSRAVRRAPPRPRQAAVQASMVRLILSPRTCGRNREPWLMSFGRATRRTREWKRCGGRSFERPNAGNCAVLKNFFNSINFDNYIMYYIKLCLLLHIIFDDAELLFPSNIFRNLSIFILFFSIAKSVSLIAVSRDFMPLLLIRIAEAPKISAPRPSWRGVPRLAQRRQKESTENAGKCAVHSGSWGQIRTDEGLF